MRLSKKLAAVAVAAGIALTASAAFAYWTTTGSASGSGDAGTVGLLTVSVTLASGSHPGDSPGAAVSGTVTNGTSSAILVSNIAQNGPVTFDSGHSGCNASWFSFATVAPTGGALTLAPAGSVGYTGRLVMSESGSDQNACQGATITLPLAAS